MTSPMFFQARPHLFRSPSQEQTFAFHVETDAGGVMEGPKIETGYVVGVRSKANPYDYWEGVAHVTGVRKGEKPNGSAVSWRSVIVLLRFKGTAPREMQDDAYEKRERRFDAGDSEIVTVVTGPTPDELEPIIDETDVVIDFP